MQNVCIMLDRRMAHSSKGWGTFRLYLKSSVSCTNCSCSLSSSASLSATCPSRPCSCSCRCCFSLCVLDLSVAVCHYRPGIQGCVFAKAMQRQQRQTGAGLVTCVKVVHHYLLCNDGRTAFHAVIQRCQYLKDRHPGSVEFLQLLFFLLHLLKCGCLATHSYFVANIQRKIPQYYGACLQIRPCCQLWARTNFWTKS